MNDAEYVLEGLKDDPTFKDFIVSVAGRQFRVHRAVLAAASDVFRNAVANAYEHRWMEIDDSSPAAVEALIDFVYCLDVRKRLREDPQLAYGVFELATRYNVAMLLPDAARAAAPLVTVEKSVFFLTSFSQTEDSLDARFDIRLYIAKRLRKVVRRCPDFGDVEVQDLEDILTCTELIATELEKFEAVDKWIRLSGNTIEFHVLLACIHFEIFSKAEREYILSRSEHISPSKMKELVDISTSLGKVIPDAGKWFRKHGKSGRSSRSWKRYANRDDLQSGEGTIVLLTYPGNVVPRNSSRYHFRVNNWIVSAHFEGYTAPSTLVLTLLHRERADDLRTDFHTEIYAAKIKIRARLVGEHQSISSERLLLSENRKKGEEFRIHLLNGIKNSWLSRIQYVMVKFDVMLPYM